MTETASYHKPKFCIGNSPIQKTIIDSKELNFWNYFQSFWPFAPVTGLNPGWVWDFTKGPGDLYYLFWNHGGSDSLGSLNYCLVSSNFKHWSLRPYGHIQNGPQETLENYTPEQNQLFGPWSLLHKAYSVVYGQDTLVMVGKAINPLLLKPEHSMVFQNFCTYTTDGNTWLSAQLPYSQDWRSITYGDGKFLTVAPTVSSYLQDPLNSSSGISPTNLAAISNDGINWSGVTLPVSAFWDQVAYGGEKFVALCANNPEVQFYNTDNPQVLTVSISAAYSTDGINWQMSPLAACSLSALANQNWVNFSLSNAFTIPEYRQLFRFNKIYYLKNKFFTTPVQITGTSETSINGASELNSIFLYSNDGIIWNTGVFPLPSIDPEFPPLSSHFTNSPTGNWSKPCEMNGEVVMRPKFVGINDTTSGIPTTQRRGSALEYYSTDMINWKIRKSLSIACLETLQGDNNQRILLEGNGSRAKQWAFWCENFLPETKVLFKANFIPLKVSVNNGSYTIDQFGTNNPTLTCHREANYDFVMDSSASSHPFALRTNLNNTISDVAGAYSNNIINGISAGKIMFTPNKDTPNTIYYQCTTHPSISGVIHIKNW